MGTRLCLTLCLKKLATLDVVLFVNHGLTSRKLRKITKIVSYLRRSKEALWII